MNIPKQYTVSEQVTYLCQQLKSVGGYDDLIRFLQAKDKDTRHAPRKTKQAEVVNQYGGKVKGGRPSKRGEQINLENKEITYQDMGKLKGKLRF